MANLLDGLRLIAALRGEFGHTLVDSNHIGYSVSGSLVMERTPENCARYHVGREFTLALD